MVSMMSLATPTSEAGRAMVGACVYIQGQKTLITLHNQNVFSIELGPITRQNLFERGEKVLHQGLLNEGII